MPADTRPTPDLATQSGLQRLEAYYHTKGAWSRPGTIELACDLVPDWGTGRHLDIGCAVGKLLKYAQSLHRKRLGIGVDLTFRLLDLARRRFGVPDHLVQASGCQLPFHDASFDVITATEVLEHVPDLNACLAEIARVLAPGGWFSFTMPVYANLLWLDKTLGDRRLCRSFPSRSAANGLPMGWAPWEPEPIERAVRPRKLLHCLDTCGLVPHRAFTRDWFVTLDRCFIGRSMERLAPRLWQSVQRRAEPIDRAFERISCAIPPLRFLGYKLFCVCRRQAMASSDIRTE